LESLEDSNEGYDPTYVGYPSISKKKFDIWMYDCTNTTSYKWIFASCLQGISSVLCSVFIKNVKTFEKKIIRF